MNVLKRIKTNILKRIKTNIKKRTDLPAFGRSSINLDENCLNLVYTQRLTRVGLGGEDFGLWRVLDCFPAWFHGVKDELIPHLTST